MGLFLHGVSTSMEIDMIKDILDIAKRSGPQFSCSYGTVKGPLDDCNSEYVVASVIFMRGDEKTCKDLGHKIYDFCVNELPGSGDIYGEYKKIDIGDLEITVKRDGQSDSQRGVHSFKGENSV